MSATWKRNAGNIWCRGDSITRGRNSDLAGWRTIANTALVTAGISKLWVGSQATGTPSLAHDGIDSDTCAAAKANVGAAAALYRPAITVFWLGTNDEWFGSDLATTKTDWDACVDAIFSGCPTTKMLALDPLDRTGHTAGTAAIAAAMPAWVAAHQAAGQNVALVSVRSLIDPVTQTDDGTHPTQAGYAALEPTITAAIVSLVHA